MVQFALYEAKQETHTFVSRWLTAVVHKQSKLSESRTAGFMCILGNFKVCLGTSLIREAVNGFGVLLQGSHERESGLRKGVFYLCYHTHSVRQLLTVPVLTEHAYPVGFHEIFVL